MQTPPKTPGTPPPGTPPPGLEEILRRLAALEAGQQASVPSAPESAPSFWQQHPSLQEEIQALLRPGETLDQCLEQALRHEIRRRQQRQRGPGLPPAPHPQGPSARQQRGDLASRIIAEHAHQGLAQEHFELMPQDFIHLLEYDLMHSRWHPRPDWIELLEDFLRHCPPEIPLVTWIDLRRQKDIEEQARAWVKISQK